MTITAGVEVRHDSNAARASAARAAARGLVRDDFVASPTLELALAKPLGRNQVNLNATLAYDFYARNDQLDRERIGVAGSGIVQLGRCTVTAAPSFSRRQSDLGEIAIPLAGGSDAVRNVQTEQVYAGTVECGGAIGLRPVAGIERDIADNSNAFRRFSDNRRTHYTAGLGYARPTFGKLQLLYGRDEVNYPNRPRIGDDEDGYTSNQGGVRFERGIGANLQGTVQVNYLSLDPRRSDVPSFSGVTYDVGLVATFADRLKLGIVLNRAAQPALQTDAAFRIQRSWDLTANYAVSSLLAFNASASFAKRTYIGERSTFGPPLGNDRRNSYIGGAVYNFSPRLRFSADVRYQQRNGSDPIYDYSNLSETIAVKFVY